MCLSGHTKAYYKTVPTGHQDRFFLHLWYFNESNDIWFWQKLPLSKQTKGCESLQRSGAWGEVRGGWPLLAVRKERVCITGSCVLYERDREGFTKKEMTWKRDSQSEREASQPLERTLRLTPSYSPPFSICKYSTSSEDSLLIVFDVILFIIIKTGGVWEENTYGSPWSHNNW